jgi:predicted transcriptional regulator of viral defense system
MGKEKHLTRILRLFEKSPVVSYATIERTIGNAAYSRLFLHNLVRNKKIFRLAKGFYTAHAETSLAVHCFHPAYLGLQSLSAHGVSEQETIPVILTTSKARVGLHPVMDSKILVRRLDKKHFFGFNTLHEGDYYIPYSDLEKTFIDMVVFRQLLTPEAIKEIKKRIQIRKLHAYLESYSPQTIKRVLEKIKQG